MYDIALPRMPSVRTKSVRLYLSSPWVEARCGLGFLFLRSNRISLILIRKCNVKIH